MTDPLDDIFADMPERTYPGSRQVIRPKAKEEKVRAASASRAMALLDPADWPTRPVKHRVGSQYVELYPVGCLAAALERSVPAIRVWESKRYIPPAPFRIEHIPGKGGVTGRRYYNYDSIAVAVEEFYKRRLLGSGIRINWSQHGDLHDAIGRRWAQIASQYLS